MSFLPRLCLGLVLLVPSLAYAQSSLDVPSEGDKLSGIGAIHGWKCTAEGEITIGFNAGDPIPATYGYPREDTSAACGDDDGNNGFYTFFNWAILGDGEHTAIAYDNGVEFARNTFTVTTTGEEFLRDVNAIITFSDFPSPGETTVLEWNQSTQHFEMTEVRRSASSQECMVDLTVPPGASCTGSISSVPFTFSVNAEEGCIASALVNQCYATRLDLFGASASRNDDGSWIITALP